jgi:hypothetical protein
MKQQDPTPPSPGAPPFLQTPLGADGNNNGESKGMMGRLKETLGISAGHPAEVGASC